MQVNYTGSTQNVVQAVSSSNNILNNPAFYDKISAHSGFDFTQESPKSIAEWMRQSNQTMVVRLYRGRIFSKAIAYTSPQYPNTLFLNTRRLDRDVADIVNTIIHECVHCLDQSIPGHDFGHGDNSSVGKGNSAPYWIGSLAEQFAKGTQESLTSMETKSEMEVIEHGVDIDPNEIEE